MKELFKSKLLIGVTIFFLISFYLITGVQTIIESNENVQEKEISLNNY